MIKFFKNSAVVALLFFWLAPAGLVLSDIFWWMLTDHKWSSIVYDVGRVYLTLAWVFVMAFPCLAGIGAITDD